MPNASNEISTGLAIRQATRDLATTLTAPRFWLIITCIVAVCFISGPFGTQRHMPTGFRLIYWAAVVLPTAILGVWTLRFINAKQWTSVLPLTLISVAFGMCVSAIVIALDFAMLNPLGQYPGAFILFKNSFPVAVVIFVASLVYNHFNRDSSTAADVKLEAKGNSNPNAVPERPALLDRLDKHREATVIVSLCAQDHYVEVTTDLGAELCLIRLNDAIAEAHPTKGFQIHRSNWVAKAAVTKLETGKSPQVHLTSGQILKVSQKRMPDLKAFLK